MQSPTHQQRRRSSLLTLSFNSQNKSPLQWEIINSATGGPNLMHHCGQIINGYLYVHGGLSVNSLNSQSAVPLSSVYRINLENGQWEELHASGAAPSLSQHACATLQQRHLLLIGGWNGTRRTSDLAAFDTHTQSWLAPPPSQCGFTQGAGLSGHTVTRISASQLLVIGREGGLRTQRRHGQAYTLSIPRNVGEGGKRGEFHYELLPIHMDSRSKHCSVLIGSSGSGTRSDLVVIGGRDDKMIDHRTNFLIGSSGASYFSSLLVSSASVSSTSEGQSAVSPPPSSVYLLSRSYITNHMLRVDMEGNRTIARRGHCCVLGSEPRKEGDDEGRRERSSWIAILGGTSFSDTRMRTQKDAHLYDVRTGEYYAMGALDEARSNGVCCTDERTGFVYYHGGVDEHGHVRNTLMRLVQSGSVK